MYFVESLFCNHNFSNFQNMKVLVPILLALALSVCANSSIRQPKEIAQRRQSLIGYTNNIFHENPAYPDQAAQSSVNVHFNPSNQIDTKTYYSNPYANMQQQQQQQQPQKIQQQQEYTPSYQTNSQHQSQLFNVGYSVSFTNGQQPQQPKPFPAPVKYTRASLDDAEIITGTRKQNEQVQVPNINMSPEDFVSTALLDNKKHKISGIKPKPQFVQSYQNPKALINQANLSPTTQKYFKVLEQIKPQVTNTQDIQQRYSWRNLGPGVEIIRSTEVPTISQKYSRSEQQPVQFDHSKALGRSQDFDYSNAVDSGNSPQNNFYQFTQKVQPLPPITRVLPGHQAPVAVPKLAIDTSLLREQIPIQVDTRYLDEAMRAHLGVYKTQGQYSQPEQSQSQSQNQESYLYRTIPSAYRPAPETMQFQDYQTDQSRFQYKIYGKPQIVAQNGFSNGHEQIRQPRYLTDLHTNLRPPPFNAVTYQRRIHIG